MLLTVGGEHPHSCLQGVDAVNHQAAGDRGKKSLRLDRVFSPIDRLAVAAPVQRDPAGIGVALQNPEVELNEVPSSDNVRVMPRDPLIELFKDLPDTGAVDERETVDSL